MPFRSPSFVYKCKCAESCLEKNQVLCLLNKNSRNNCKHCRYAKCVSSAGMVSKWVLQQYIPKVKNRAQAEGNEGNTAERRNTTAETSNANLVENKVVC